MASMTPCAELSLVYVHFLFFFMLLKHTQWPLHSVHLAGIGGTLHELRFVLVLLISEEPFNLVSATRNVRYFQSLFLSLLTNHQKVSSQWRNFNLVSGQNVKL